MPSKSSAKPCLHSITALAIVAYILLILCFYIKHRPDAYGLSFLQYNISRAEILLLSPIRVPPLPSPMYEVIIDIGKGRVERVHELVYFFHTVVPPWV